MKGLSLMLFLFCLNHSYGQRSNFERMMPIYALTVEIAGIDFLDSQVDTLVKLKSELEVKKANSDVQSIVLRKKILEIINEDQKVQLLDSKKKFFHNQYYKRYRLVGYDEGEIEKIKEFYINLSDTLNVGIKSEKLKKYVNENFLDEAKRLADEKIELDRELRIAKYKEPKYIKNVESQKRINKALLGKYYKKLKRLNKKYIKGTKNKEKIIYVKELYKSRLDDFINGKRTKYERVGKSNFTNQLEYYELKKELFTKIPDYCLYFCPEYINQLTKEDKTEFNENIRQIIKKDAKLLAKLYKKKKDYRDRMNLSSPVKKGPMIRIVPKKENRIIISYIDIILME